MHLKIRLTILSFLEFAVWGAYLTSMGTFLASIGMASRIGWFYSVQGFVSLFMPALMGMVADRWIPAQRLLTLCHFVAGSFMLAVATYSHYSADQIAFSSLFPLYACSVAFFMPTIALTNSVAYSVLDKAGLDAVKAFPPIRIFGTIGFILSMWVVDLGHMQVSPMQFAWSGLLSFLLAAYAFTLPACPVNKGRGKSLAQALGLHAFSLFKNRRMAMFFIFSMLLGVCLQITNGFANPFITSFGKMEEYSGTFGVEHANILISLSQMSEALCILLIPFFLSRFGIKKVMLIAMLAWVLRFWLFAIGNPGDGVWLFVLSMLVYGVAFDFFNISGSIFVEKILWIVPLLSLFWFAGEFPFRRVRGYLVCGVVSAVLAGAVLYGLWAYGSAARRDTVRVTCDKGVVKVKSEAPEVWVVDDEGPALGGLLASKDIRLYYQFNPEAEGIGYVRSVGSLPKSGIRKLVLGGKSGDAWLRYVTSSEEARSELPGEVVFISPPFPFAAIPSPLFEVTKVRFLVGEFCTWYQPKEYANPPAGVEIIPGCEMYIPGWLDYVL